MKRPPKGWQFRTGAPRRAFMLLRMVCLAGIAGLAGCAVNPSTGRSQMIALPAAQIAHADMGFDLAAAAAGMSYSAGCARDRSGEGGGSGIAEADLPCSHAANIARFTRQVERIGAELDVEARDLVPELFTRISGFQIAVDARGGQGTSSSAGGRIAIAPELAALDPTDEVVAFLIAREMGNVIARHGEEDSGARMFFSALTAVVPIGGLVLKFAASMLGSQVLRSSWAERQRLDADDIALTLLERSGRSLARVAFNLRIGLTRSKIPELDWGVRFAESVERVNAMAVSHAAQARQAPFDFIENASSTKVAAISTMAESASDQ